MISSLIRAIAFVVTAAAAAEESCVLGNWRGDSICAASGTACKDERVVYHVAKSTRQPGFVTVSAAKIMNGKTINMGSLEFRFDAEKHALTREDGQGIWLLRVDRDKMGGTLTRPDETVFRRIMLHKVD